MGGLTFFLGCFSYSSLALNLVKAMSGPYDQDAWATRHADQYPADDDPRPGLKRRQAQASADAYRAQMRRKLLEHERPSYAFMDGPAAAALARQRAEIHRSFLAKSHDGTRIGSD